MVVKLPYLSVKMRYSSILDVLELFYATVPAFQIKHIRTAIYSHFIAPKSNCNA